MTAQGDTLGLWNLAAAIWAVTDRPYNLGYQINLRAN